ncbi:MAG: hypothetical protein HY057_05210 [Rhodospirillales bacterium]|nr:hypothetical protein [Rhodospirillales bacterium]
MKRADGSLLDVAINSVTVEVGGRPLIASFIINLTHQKKVESALREAKEEAEIGSASKSEFLANMSHELRTPLNAIIGFTDIILRELFGPMGNQRYVDYLRDIEGSAQHLLQVIGDILDMAKIEAGQAELQEELVELRPVLSSCLRLVAERAHRGGVTLKEETAVDLPLLVADQRKLKQILLNLLSNAVKFTPKDGEVILAAAVNGDGRLELSVIDTGIGMSESDIVTALKPFGQVEGSLARKFEGSGLGLPITKALVEMHGGQMRIASTPGTGTTVWVVLPAKRLLDSASLAR